MARASPQGYLRGRTDEGYATVGELSGQVKVLTGKTWGAHWSKARAAASPLLESRSRCPPPPGSIVDGDDNDDDSRRNARSKWAPSLSASDSTTTAVVWLHCRSITPRTTVVALDRASLQVCATVWVKELES